MAVGEVESIYEPNKGILEAARQSGKSGEGENRRGHSWTLADFSGLVGRSAPNATERRVRST
jgi:hypothetical protein